MSKTLHVVLPSSCRCSLPKSGRKLVSAGDRKTELLAPSGDGPAMASKPSKPEDRIQISARLVKILVCLSAALIAVIDLSLPANIYIATLYFVVVVLAGWTCSAKWLWGSTAICILLTFGAVTLAPAHLLNPITWIDWLNRSMIAVTLAVAAIPVALRLHS